MSFYHVQPLLRKTKKVILYGDELNRQWVGTWDAMYHLYDMPGVVRCNDLLEMMNVDSEKRYKFTQEERPLPYTPTPRASAAVEGWGLPVLFDGLIYQFLYTDVGAYSVLEEHLKPVTNSWRNKEYYIHQSLAGEFLEIYYGSVPLALIRTEPLLEDSALVVRLWNQAERVMASARKNGKGREDQPALFEEDV